MDATLYEVRAAAAARVKLALVENTNFTKSPDGGYSNSTAKTLITETNNVLAAQYCEHTNDGMTGLGEEATNTLNSHKSNIAITKREVLNQSKTEAEQASTADITVAPQITTNSVSRSPTPPPAGRSSSRYKKRHEPKAFNATNCKHCKKYGGNGYAHDPPKSISHDDCFFNKKHKGWRPRPVCKMMDIAYRHGESFQRDE